MGKIAGNEVKPGMIIEVNGHDGILLASGAGALGVLLGGVVTGPTGVPEFRPEVGVGEPPDADVLPSAIGLVWRALLVWMVVRRPTRRASSMPATVRLVGVLKNFTPSTPCFLKSRMRALASSTVENGCGWLAKKG